MVLEELVQHVEEVVLHQRLDDQLVQVVLQRANANVKTHAEGAWQRSTAPFGFT